MWLTCEMCLNKHFFLNGLFIPDTDTAHQPRRHCEQWAASLWPRVLCDHAGASETCCWMLKQTDRSLIWAASAHLLQSFGLRLAFLQQTPSVTRGFVKNGLCEEERFVFNAGTTVFQTREDWSSQPASLWLCFSRIEYIYVHYSKLDLKRLFGLTLTLLS